MGICDAVRHSDGFTFPRDRSRASVKPWYVFVPLLPTAEISPCFEGESTSRMKPVGS